ncbi:MAG: endonuclease/exonuclease/phosphatase family metal-dependent hydrolase [Saprospiraceae bacterium]|jgi:endonuclease/exonuclease/phosphatase family metal-dependent hydrolase
MKTMKKSLKALGWFLLLFLLYAITILVHGGLTDYQPEDVEQISIEQASPFHTIEDSTLSILTWNIGYGGLGAEADFFYHGSGFLLAGEDMVRPSAELVNKYNNGINDFLKNNPADFILLQEVDFDSKRSYHINQFEQFKNTLRPLAASKALNFKVDRVPAPALQPWKAYGKCLSGLASFSRYQPTKSTRYQLPGVFDWPDKPFMLDRCLQVSRFSVKDGKELLVINVHNTAYEKDGKKKRQQLDFLKALILPEYEKGNYVIVGGDWNQCPPGISKNHFNTMDISAYSNLNIPDNLLPAGWKWIFDPEVATNRSTMDPFVEGKTFTALIDFFLVSPNIEALSVKGVDMKFAFSDHQPVRIDVRLGVGD